MDKLQDTIEYKFRLGQLVRIGPDRKQTGRVVGIHPRKTVGKDRRWVIEYKVEPFEFIFKDHENYIIISEDLLTPDSEYVKEEISIGRVGEADVTLVIGGVEFGVESFGWYILISIKEGKIPEWYLAELVSIARNDPYSVGVMSIDGEEVVYDV